MCWLLFLALALAFPARAAVIQSWYQQQQQQKQLSLAQGRAQGARDHVPRHYNIINNYNRPAMHRKEQTLLDLLRAGAMQEIRQGNEEAFKNFQEALARQDQLPQNKPAEANLDAINNDAMRLLRISDNTMRSRNMMAAPRKDVYSLWKPSYAAKKLPLMYLRQNEASLRKGLDSHKFVFIVGGAHSGVLLLQRCCVLMPFALFFFLRFFCFLFCLFFCF